MGCEKRSYFIGQRLIPSILGTAVVPKKENGLQFCTLSFAGSQDKTRSSSVTLVPETTLARVPLTFPSQGYRQVSKDDILHMLLPSQAPSQGGARSSVHPSSKLYVPVFLEQPTDDPRGPISALVIK